MKEKEIISYNEFRRRTGVGITIKHTGKMAGLQSLNTSCLKNKYCLARIKNREIELDESIDKNTKNKKLICEGCYAEAQMSYMPNLREMTARNTDILKDILNYEDLPNMNCLYFRFESFGDLNNDNQFINYLNICKKNPKTKFAIWTKNPWIVQSVFDKGYKKPKNLNIVLSSVVVNEPITTQYDWVDKIFTVFDEKYIEENGVEINCPKQCFNCLKCYKKTNKEFYINEILKTKGGNKKNKKGEKK